MIIVGYLSDNGLKSKADLQAFVAFWSHVTLAGNMLP